MIFGLREIILSFEVIFLVLYSTLLDYLEEIAPPYLEADWDNSGPQIDPGQESLEKVLIGLDPTENLITTGIEKEADLLITHHPLIFSPLNKVDTSAPTGKKLLSLARNRTGLTAIHTPFDQSGRGLSGALAERLELELTRPLKSLGESNLLKLEVFVPESEEEKVVESLVKAGAGEVGNYRESYYRLEAGGHFKPMESAEPYLGRGERTQSTQEVKLEFLVRRKFKKRILSTLTSVHPYEEPAFSLLETERREGNVGLGRIGKWERARDLSRAKNFVARSLRIEEKEISASGELAGPVEWVATSPGAGGEAIDPALNSSLELLITGELDYHERLEALERGLVVMEVGHRNSEKIFTPYLRELLRERFTPDELTIEVSEEVDKS